MAGASLEIMGLNEVMADLQEIPQQTNRAMNTALREAAEVAKKAEISHVNRSDKDHTHLIDDITVGSISTVEGVKAIHIGPTEKTAWRARFLENGTSKMKPYPFVLPAGNESEKEITDIMTKAIGESIQ